MSLTDHLKMRTSLGFLVAAACLLTIHLIPASIAANADLSEQRLATAKAAPDSTNTPAPEPELDSALQGLLSYALPEGWRVQFSLREYLDLIRGAMQGPVLTVGTGQAGRDMAGLTNSVIGRGALLRGDFTESAGEILGQPARIFEDESDWVSGWVSRVYVLELCAPGQTPIVFHAAMRSEEQSAHIDDVLANMRLNLPEGMTPCPEAMSPGSIWSRDGRLAIGGIEGMDGRATLQMVSLRPIDRDQAFPNISISVDHPRSFNTNFQVGNRHGHGFAEAPNVADTQVAGHDVLAFTGFGEAGERRWDLHVYLLQNCLPDGAPVIVTRRRDIDDPLAAAVPDPMLEQIFIDLQADASPCNPDLIDDALERVEATRPTPIPADPPAEPTVSDPASETALETALPRDLSHKDPATVRALGAFGLLPDDFMATAQALRDQGKDLLAADQTLIQNWMQLAQKGQLQLGIAERNMLRKLVSLLHEFELPQQVSADSPSAPADVSAERQDVLSGSSRLAGGYDHTVILDDHGQAWAVGNNPHGQLGHESDDKSNVLTRVTMPEGISFVSVSAYGRHSLALDTHGHVWSWGNGIHGQLGNGLDESASSPVRVNLPEDIRIIAIAAGAGHSLAVDAEGRVWAWGFNGQGRLGDGTTTNSSTPIQVKLPEHVHISAITAGSNHSLAIDSDGIAWAWGNGAGRLGNGRVLRQPVPVKVNMPDQTRFTQIAASTGHSLALDQYGQAWAWGEAWRVDGAGLGDGSSGRHLSPIPLTLPEGLAFADIDVGASHNLALATDGSVWAWGRNAEGQLGDGSGSAQSIPIAVPLPPNTQIEQIAAGAHHSIALTRDGDVLVWGENEQGQLGSTEGGSQKAPLSLKWTKD